LPDVAAGPTAELHVAGEFSDVADPGEMAEGLAVVPFGCTESPLEGVFVCAPFCIGVSNPEFGEADEAFGDGLNGCQLFIVIFGSSSIRKLDLRRVCAGAR
jgi:hypothetical protein